mgnify:CR=1 FL=1
MATATGKYFIKRKESDVWEDIAVKFPSVNVLNISGMGGVGDSLNVYNAQWLSSEQDDFQVTTTDTQGNPVIIRKNTDIELTFICGERYGAIDTQECYDDFVAYIAKQGDFWIKSGYTGLMAHVISMKGFQPTTQKLHRGTRSYITATAPLHCLAPATEASEDPVVGDIYLGFGGATIGTEAQIKSLTNVQHYNIANYAGTYTIVNPSIAYLWICLRGALDNYSVYGGGFDLPLNAAVSIGEYRCYRSTNSIVAHTMIFNITHNS